MESGYIRLKEIKPELSDYIYRATVLLNDPAFPDDKSVHDIRVLLKKARAVLKLIGPQFTSDYNHMDIPDLKECAQILSGWRESAVYRKILKNLKAEFPEIFDRLNGNEKITILLRKPVHSLNTEKTKLDTERIHTLLKKVGYRIRLTGMSDADPYKLMDELENSYSIVVESYLAARYKSSVKRLHTLRKKSKDFLYQLYFFRPLNPGPIKKLEHDLQAVARNLGRIHDLEELVKALDYRYPGESQTGEMNELMVRIREKQDKYLRKVWPVASEIFMTGMKLHKVLGYKVPAS